MDGLQGDGATNSTEPPRGGTPADGGGGGGAMDAAASDGVNDAVGDVGRDLKEAAEGDGSGGPARKKERTAALTWTSMDGVDGWHDDGSPRGMGLTDVGAGAGAAVGARTVGRPWRSWRQVRRSSGTRPLRTI
ncbi:hypothetical protein CAUPRSCDRAFT_13089 [Caulochytrium protostelioides]|uniref:Uncharacterized protein n=1 Tax=Caulochytrium protostelioides TaxID=1555241 RepID=A0A4P9WSL1_9FUNG|nr:hypothetical protein CAUPRSCDRAFT_13089 [Caulochytrium protostelioides]